MFVVANDSVRPSIPLLTLRVQHKQEFMFWEWAEDAVGNFTFEREPNGDLTLRSRVELRDQLTYKLRLTLVDKRRRQAAAAWIKTLALITETSVEIRIDSRALVFAKEEYLLALTSESLVGQDLLRIEMKTRFV